MQEIDGKYSIKRKKLMKTTTLITLLVAATMILSGAVTGITMNLNENIIDEAEDTGTVITYGSGDDSIVAIGEPEIISPQLEFAHPVKPRIGESIVWDNGLDYSGMGSSQDDTQYPLFTEIADDFQFDFTQGVSDVHWVGGYWNGAPAAFDWRITFYKNSGGVPGNIHAGPFQYPESDLDIVDLGGGYFEYGVDLPATVSFSGGVKYWIGIQGVGFFPPQSGFGRHLGVIGDGYAFRGEIFTGTPDWLPNYSPGYDACFQLTAKVLHDVGVTEIKHPTHMDSPGCPCIPVEVEVTNFAENDEVDVPVTVEIHRNLWTQTFGGDIPDEMPFYIDGGDCSWQYVPMETSYPNAINPFNGAFFAELNQFGCLGTSYLTTEMPTDLTEQCIDPFIKFYFWHDQYGSDDYMTVEANDGSGWTQIGGPYFRLCCPDCPEGWTEYRISLADYIGQPAVMFRFVGHCEMPLDAYNLGLDFVSVFDMEYQETQTVDIDAGETIQVEFPCWSIECFWCEYENDDILFHVGAWTEMEGDEILNNDGFGPLQTGFVPTLIHIPWTHDVGDKEITEPSEDYYLAQPLEMIQTIKNYGKEPEGCFNVYMEVRDLSISTELDEDFDTWEDNPPPDGSGSLSDDRPVGWRDYGTNYYYDYGWEDMNSNYAGGTAPEARLYYGYIVNYVDMVLESPSINTQGFGKLELEFKSMINNYAGGYYCTVETRADPGDPWTDITPWPNPVMGDVPADTYTIDITAEIGIDTQVKFVFNGYGWNLDYWYVDDVKFISYTCGEEIYYSEQVCVDDIAVCQELEVAFPDWTPEPPEPCYCGTQDYCIISYTKMLDPPDQNAANDMKQKFITIEWFHDVALNGFTDPVYDIGMVDWIGYSDGHTENAYKWTDMSPWTMAIELSDPELIPYRGGKLTDLSFNSGCDDYGFYAEQYDIRYATGSLPDISAVTPIASGTASATGWTTISVPPQTIPGSGSAFAIVTFTTSVGFPAGFDYDNGDVRGQHMLNTLTTNDWILLSSLWGSPVVFGIEAGVIANGNGGEVPDPDMYLPCGEQEFCVEIENLGTYDEDVDVVWTFYEYTPYKEIVDSGSVAISLGMGDVEEVCLFTYLFEADGVYEVEVEVVSPTDCNPDNNGPINLVIGIDCCAPESCFVIDPEAPDGENNWYVSPVTVTVDAWENCELQSGVAEIVYIIDGVMDSIPGDHGTFVIDGDGLHFIEIYAVDNVGNEEEEHRTFEVAIDETEPTIDLVHDVYEDDSGNYMIDFTATANDATSGMNRVEFKIDGVLDLTLYAAPYEWTVVYEDGMESKTFSAHAYDNAGNSASDSVTGVKTTSTTTTHSQTQSQPVVKQVVTLNLGR